MIYACSLEEGSQIISFNSCSIQRKHINGSYGNNIYMHLLGFKNLCISLIKILHKTIKGKDQSTCIFRACKTSFHTLIVKLHWTNQWGWFSPDSLHNTHIPRPCQLCFWRESQVKIFHVSINHIFRTLFGGQWTFHKYFHHQNSSRIHACLHSIRRLKVLVETQPCLQIELESSSTIVSIVAWPWSWSHWTISLGRIIYWEYPVIASIPTWISFPFPTFI